MQVTEGRVNPAYKLQVFFFLLALYGAFFFFFLSFLAFLFFKPLALSGTGRDSHKTRAM